jgi:VWFA-related protein
MARFGCSLARFAFPASILLAALGLLVALGAPAGAAAPQTPAFPAGVDIVRIDAVVLDRDGRPVRGLTAADFEVLENGKRRDIASFETIDVRPQSSPAPGAPVTPDAESVPRVLLPEEGRAVLVYFDDIHVQPENATRMRAALAPFLSRELRPGDAITIVAPQKGLWWTARSAWEHAQLPAVVERLRGQYIPDPFGDHVSDWEVMQEVEYKNVKMSSGSGIDPGRSGSAGGIRGTMYVPGIDSSPGLDRILLDSSRRLSARSVRFQERYGLSLLRIQRSLNGLQRAVESLAGFRGRKSVVIYSEGFILSPSLPDYERVIDLCRRANVALYVVDPRGLRTGSVPSAAEGTPLGTEFILPGTRYAAESAGSTHIALATGGAAYESNDVNEALARVLEESRAYYLIGFQPVEGPAGERKLQVRVRGKDLRVRARNRYFAGDTPDALGDAAVVRASRELSDRAEVPIRVATVPGEATGIVELRLSLEPVQPARERTLKLLVEARPLGGGPPVHDVANLTVPAATDALDVMRELHLAPGVWQARVVVTDTDTGAIGSALHTFEVRTRTASSLGPGGEEATIGGR